MPGVVTGPGKGEASMLAGRLRSIRAEAFGEDGVPDLARQLGLPDPTWRNYEAGVSMPATVLLGFLELASAEPRWLLTGQGPRYRTGPDQAGRPASPRVA